MTHYSTASAERPIPPNLSRYGDQIRAGLVATEYRRRDIANAWPARAQRRSEWVPLPSEPTEPEEECHANAFPKDVKFWPVLGLIAMRGGHSGAWRIWRFAKTLDPEGSGVVYRDHLLAFAESLGVSSRQRRRWLGDALRIGLLRPHAWRSGSVYYLASLMKAARIFGADYIGQRPANLPVDILIGKGWRSEVWVAFLATLRGQIISRATMREITGVPEATQRRLEADMGVIRRPNYAVSEQKADRLAGEREFGRKHAFKWHDRAIGEDVISWRQPDSRIPPEYAQSGRRGRTRKINTALKVISSNMGRELSKNVARIFYSSHKAAERATRRFGKSNERLKITEVFYKRFQGRLATVWSVVPL